MNKKLSLLNISKNYPEFNLLKKKNQSDIQKDFLSLEENSKLENKKGETEKLELITKLRKESAKLYQLRKYLEALQKLQDATQLYPRDLELLYYQSLCLFRLKNYERSLSILNKIESIDNSCPIQDLPKIKSLILLRQEKFQEAENYLQKLTSYIKNDFQLLNMLAYSLERQGKETEAEILLKKILKKNPDNVNAANSLAYIFVKKHKNLNEATQLIKIALQKEKNNPNYLDTFAVILIAKGNKLGAKKAWNKALKFSPGNTQILMNMRNANKAYALKS